jgi:hypothetical protein
MKLTNVITTLQTILAKHGNLDVVVPCGEGWHDPNLSIMAGKPPPTTCGLEYDEDLVVIKNIKGAYGLRP